MANRDLSKEPTLIADRDLVGTTLGQYILRELIREGGYGTVYRAEDPALEREVVVKVLRERRSDSDSRERFLREAKLAAQLDHPYAAHVYAFGAEDEGRLLWIAMERVRGIALDEWLDEHGPMSPEQFGPFFEGVCEVVHVAHEHGITHRDLKPPNIMVVESGGRLLPKLLDFGIAKRRRHPEVTPDLGLAEDHDDHDAVKTDRLPVRPRRARRKGVCDDSESRRQLTPPGGCLGSPPYMAFEQWVGADMVGPEADIYALAIIAYEMLTGRQPFVASQRADYFDQHKRASAPQLGDGFPPALDQVIRCALEKNPRARPSTALELASDLRRALRQIKREQLRAAAQQYFDLNAAPGLLWGADVLEENLRSVPEETLSPLERSFVADSQRRIRQIRRARRALVFLAIVVASGAVLSRAMMQSRMAEAIITQSELEQGRAALLHGEPEAQRHLAEAYKRDPVPTTAFMLARAMQPRLSELARLQGTYGHMRWAAFSPDGSQVATADDGAAQIWDGQTHRLLFTLPHGSEVYQTVYSPDGAWLVTLTDTRVKIWDAKTGMFIRDLATPPDEPTRPNFQRAAISSTGKLVAAMYVDGSVTRVWDAGSGKLVAELRDPHPDGFLRMAFSQTGYLATTGGNDAHVFDVRTWRRVLTVPGPVRGLAFDARGRLATGSAAGDVSIFEIPSGQRLRQLRQSGESVESLAFSSDGELVAAGGREGTMQVWWAGSGALRSQLNLRRSEILAVELEPTSASLLAAHADGTAVVADVAQGLPIAIFDGPRSALGIAKLGPRGQVIGAFRDGTARIWDATAPYRRWSSEPMSDNCGIVPGVQPDSRFVAVGCGTRPTRVWDTAQDRLLAELPSVTPIESGGFTSAFPAVSAGGDRAAIARGTAVELYELPGGRLLRRIEHAAPVSAVAFAPMGRDLVSGAVDGSILITRDDGFRRALQAPAGIDVADLLPDGRVVVGDAEQRLREFRPTGAVLAAHEVPVRVMSLRREGTRLIALPSYRAPATPPVVVDIDHPHVIARLEGHTGRVVSARWIAQGRIITAGADGTARVWDGSTGTLLQMYEGWSGLLRDAILTSEGLVIGGDTDGSLRFWDAASGAKLWTLPVHKSAVIGVHLDGADIVTRGFGGELSRWRLPQSGAVMEACAHHPPCASVRR
jgi:serine/threonine protein kinase/WD40 repeat protein